MDAGEPCRLLDWDSTFFGCRVARVTLTRLDAREVERIRAWAHQNAVDCLYFLAAASDTESIRAAEKAAFRLTAIRVGLSRAPSSLDFVELPEVGPFDADEIPALAAIARVSHTDSRFYCDGRFPRDRCGDLYATWIERGCNGDADTVLVARNRGRPVGYLSCHKNDDGSGKIGLFAVRRDAQGKRLSHKLIEAALAWFSSQRQQSVSVVTQGQNVRALAFYQKNGFVTRSMDLWYHFWLSGPGAKGS